MRCCFRCYSSRALGLLLFLLLPTVPAWAQFGAATVGPAPSDADPRYRLELVGQPFIPPANLESFFSSETPDDLNGGVYVRLLQFFSPLTAERRRRLEQSWHVRLLDSLGPNLWRVAFPASFNRYLLNGYGVRAVVRLTAENKLAPALQQAANASETPAAIRARDAGRAAPITEALLRYLPSTDTAALRAQLVSGGARVRRLDAATRTVTVQAPAQALRPLAELPAVLALLPAPVVVPPAPAKKPVRPKARVGARRR